MWLSDRRRLLAGAAALLGVSACGFTPVYAPGEVGDRLRGQVEPREPRNRDEFNFASRLDDRIGGSGSSRFELKYSIETDSDKLAITPDQETLRYHLTGTATFSVVDRTTGTVLSSGEVESFTSYSAIGTTVATRASEKDAEERLMVILADQVVTRLLGTAGTWLP